MPIIDGHLCLGRPDLVDPDLRLVVEAESHRFHSRREGPRRDCRRYTAFAVAGWRVVRFSWEDVMFRPEYVREQLELLVVRYDERAQPLGVARPTV